MPIQRLPIVLANQIAAGEVVERPASVVKELVENSLDAGATQLEIDIEQGGTKRIRIRDNGSGIAHEELELALSRHATSKIATLDDLEAINSLGFRGEALASISSVSRLTLTSKPTAQDAAWQAWAEGRDMAVQLKPAAHPDGTTIDVMDLFFNTPARRKFLRTEKTEFTHIDEVVKRIALARFDVDIRLRHNQKELRSYRAGQAQDAQQRRIQAICGTTFAEDAIRIDTQHGRLHLHGWIAPAAKCRHQADVQYAYVNGRMMRDRVLNHAIRQAYGEHLAEDRVPTFVLYLSLPASEVDVNVHPAKHEVRFHQSREIHDFIVAALQEVLQQRRPSEERNHYQYQSAPTESVRSKYLPSSRSPLPAAASLNALRTEEIAPALAARKDWQVISVVAERFGLLQRGAVELTLLDLAAVQKRWWQRDYLRKLEQGLAGQPLLVPIRVPVPVTDRQQTRLAQLGVQLQLTRQSVEVMQVPSVLRQMNISAELEHLLKLVDADEWQIAVGTYLAEHQLQSQYSLVQAEFWLKRWQSELSASCEFVQPLELPEGVL